MTFLLGYASAIQPSAVQPLLRAAFGAILVLFLLSAFVVVFLLVLLDAFLPPVFDGEYHAFYVLLRVALVSSPIFHMLPVVSVSLENRD